MFKSYFVYFCISITIYFSSPFYHIPVLIHQLVKDSVAYVLILLCDQKWVEKKLLLMELHCISNGNAMGDIQCRQCSTRWGLGTLKGVTTYKPSVTPYKFYDLCRYEPSHCHWILFLFHTVEVFLTLMTVVNHNNNEKVNSDDSC